MKRSLWMSMIAAGLLIPAVVRADDEDGPGRGVARIGLMQGDVSVKRGDSGEWVAAAPNAPLVTGDQVITGANSRIELQFDHANFARATANTEVRLSELEYQRYTIQLASGLMTYRVLRNLEADVEISTPSVAVRPLKKGVYRIAVTQDNTTEITVRSGEVEIYTPRGTERLRAGKTMLVRGSTSDPEFQEVREIPDDDWDRWSERRDRDLERSSAYRYVSTSIYGAEDLDSHGRWVYDQPYGWVWTPTVAAGWAPYRDGRWSWIDWYGWSWVSYDPWGWAPYHYGRWYWGNAGWCWYPGGIATRHHWSPALVAWFGFGGGGGLRVGAGVGWGNIGWIPLAPHEPYHRWYGSRYYRGFGNRTYVDNSVNIVNNVNITNIYRNSRVNNAVTAVNTGDFTSGRGNHIRINDSDFRGASLVRGQVPVAPDRSSLRWSDREVSPNPRASNGDGRFYSRRGPSRSERVSFDDQRRGMEEVSRRTFGDRGANASAGGAVDPSRTAEPTRREGGRPAELGSGNPGRRSEIRESGPAGEPAASRTGGADRSSDGRGWRTFGEPRQTEQRPSEAVRPTDRRAGSESRGSQGAASENRDRGGWRRVGEGSNRTPESGQSSESRSSTSGRGWRGDDSPAGGRSSQRYEPPASSPSIQRRSPESSPRRESGTWQRFPDNGGVGRSGRSESPRVESPRMESPRSSPRTESPRSESPRVDSPRPRMESPRVESPRGGGGGGEPVRVDPPIVRERNNFQSIERRGGDRGVRTEGSFGQPRPERQPRSENFRGSPGGSASSGRISAPSPRSGGGWEGGSPRGSFGGGGGGAGRMSNGGSSGGGSPRSGRSR